MAKTLKMPVLGQSVEEVRIIQWLKKEGDTVAVGDNLAEIETDKVNTFFESPEAGVIKKILVPAESFVAVEAPVVIVGEADEEIAPTPGPSPADGRGETKGADSGVAVAEAPIGKRDSPLPSAGEGPGVGAISPRARRTADEKGVDLSLLAGRGTGPKGRVQEKDVLAVWAELGAATETAERSVKASPLARAVAGTEGVDLGAVTGSGLGGRITADDVRASVPTSPAGDVAPTLPTSGKRTLTLTGLRKRVADNIAKSVRNSPHVTLNLAADMTEATRLRAMLLPTIEKATGVRLSPTDIIVKAAAVALKEFPYVNAHIVGDTITFFDDVHIGLAVSLGEDGLIVPLIRDAHRKGLGEIAAARQDIATRARAGKLTGEDITGGTFSVTNLGNYGITSFNPIIAPPQVAILGVGSIADTVVAKEGVPTVRPMMGLSLSFDHRAMDGAPAAAFLARLKEILETPYLLLL